MHKHIRFISALALGMAVLLIPTIATAATTANVVDQAPLLAKGAGARVSIEVTCDFGDNSALFLNVSLTQRAGNDVARGSKRLDQRTINCDGTPQTTTFEIVAQASGKPFHKGSAVAEAFVEVCDEFFNDCQEASVTEEIQLVRK
jgi:hypothetical protein